MEAVTDRVAVYEWTLPDGTTLLQLWIDGELQEDSTHES